MTPLERYQQDLQKDDFSYDAAQEMAVNKLQQLFEKLLAKESQQPRGLWGKLTQKFKGEALEPEIGLYFWGGVGRGKTYLMDTFYDSLPFEEKTRMHFHRFMQRVHRELKALQGEKDPLLIVADRFAKETKVLCFDEFFVSDITDAMILAGLMEALFARGITLVATSNIVPDLLYKDGLQRARFLPAIELVKKYTEVVNVDGGIDYRLRTLEQAEIYHWPLDEGAYTSLKHSFEALAPDIVVKGEAIEIEGRDIQTLFYGDDVLWCDFLALCDGPRSQNDYIEIAKCYHAVLISNVPKLSAHNDDQARRFLNLIDEFYDRNVKLIISAEVPIEELYSDGRLEFEFQRAASRLLEMQSHEYLAREHLA